jgi:hypothetical protein
MKTNILAQQRKAQLIDIYMQTIANQKIQASESGTTIRINIGSSPTPFLLQTARRQTSASRQVLLR